MDEGRPKVTHRDEVVTRNQAVQSIAPAIVGSHPRDGLQRRPAAAESRPHRDDDSLGQRRPVFVQRQPRDGGATGQRDVRAKALRFREMNHCAAHAGMRLPVLPRADAGFRHRQRERASGKVGKRVAAIRSGHRNTRTFGGVADKQHLRALDGCAGVVHDGSGNGRGTNGRTVRRNISRRWL